jgi:hypothetical protein
VVHEHARIIEDELELDRLARRDGAVLVLRRHHHGVEVHRVHHRRRRQSRRARGVVAVRRSGSPRAGVELQRADRLVAAVGHHELGAIAHARADRRSGHLVAAAFVALGRRPQERRRRAQG